MPASNDNNFWIFGARIIFDFDAYRGFAGTGQSKHNPPLKSQKSVLCGAPDKIHLP